MAMKVGRRLVRSGSLSSESSDSEEEGGRRMRSIIVQPPRDLRTSPPLRSPSLPSRFPSLPSRSPSPPSRSPSPAVDRRRHRKRLPPRSAAHEREEGEWVEGDQAPPPKRKKEEIDPILTRTGGAYIPPARLRMMQQSITDKSSVAYQRISWEALKKSINGLVNKVNVSNIANIVQELFQENVVRGRGLVAQSVIKAQAASPTFTHVYAGLVAIMNTKFPQTGELIAKRLLVRFRKGFRRNDKDMCNAAVKFVAHLVNQQVLHELVALELLTLLLEDPTDDSVEVAIGFLKESGLKLTEVSPRGVHAVFETLRSVLHSGKITARVQYMVEVMFAIRKDKFKEHPVVIPELDLVQEEDQITHLLSLSDDFDTEDLLNVFHPDPDFVANEEKYKTIKAEILGEEEESSEESGEISSSEESEEEEGEDEGPKEIDMTDMTDAKVLTIRRQIYLTIMSSLDYEECAHKLLKNLEEGQEREVAHMLVEVCSQERSYLRFYGLLGQRFCQLNQIWVEMFDAVFQEQYSTVHRLETNKLRNVAKYFAQLFYGDALPWTCMSCIHLNEEETNSSSRIFVKILFQELAEFMGIPKLNERLRDPLLSLSFEGLLPRDNPKNTRFAINFFTSIGLGGLTDDLREHLKNAQKLIMAQRQEVSSSDTESDSSDSSSDNSSDSSDSSTEGSSNSSSSSSSSEEEQRPRRHGKQRAQKDRTKGKDRRPGPGDKGIGERQHQSKGRGERSWGVERNYDRKHEREEEVEERRGREGDHHRRENERDKSEKRREKDRSHRREVDEVERERKRDKDRREVDENEMEKRRGKGHRHRRDKSKDGTESDRDEGERERRSDRQKEDKRERSNRRMERDEDERGRRRDKDRHHQREKAEGGRPRESNRDEDGRSDHRRDKFEDRMERSERDEKRRTERDNDGRERRRDRGEDKDISEGYDHQRYKDNGERERDKHARDQHRGGRDKDHHSHERGGRLRINH